MSQQVPLKVTKLDPSIPLPQYANPGDSGFDLAAANDAIVYYQETALIGTGLCFEIPEGYEIQVRSRSGLALKGITVFNSPGTIDSGYRDELKVMLHNDKRDSFIIRKGDRIAQGVLAVSIQASFSEVKQLSDSVRGTQGFGSSGISEEIAMPPLSGYVSPSGLGSGDIILDIPPVCDEDKASITNVVKDVVEQQLVDLGAETVE